MLLHPLEMTSPPLANLLLFLSHSLHVANDVVLVCFQSSTVDLTTAILTNDYSQTHMNSKWLVINNCTAPASLSIIAQLVRIPFVISVVESNNNETVEQIDAMLSARNEISQATHLVVLNGPTAASDATGEVLLQEFAKKFVLLHILSWRNGLKMLTKRTWFGADAFVRSGNISDDELVRWSFADGDLPYERINYVLLCVPPFLIKTQGVVDGVSVTSVGGMEVDTIEVVASQMGVQPQYFTVDFTTSTSTENCYDCVIRDVYYEHAYTVRDIRPPVPPVQQIEKGPNGTLFAQFHDSFVYNTVILVSPHFSVGQIAHFRSQLYPHAFDGFAVVVPTEYRSASVVFKSMVDSALFRIWTVSIILFTLMRKACQRFGSFTELSHSSTLGTIFFETLGITFGTTGRSPRNRSEAVLLLFMTLFALLAGILCSGLLFQKFTTSSKTPTITTVEQLLGHTELEIVLPVWMNESLEFWTSRHGSRVSVMHDPIMMARMWNLDTKAAYIFSESAVRSILGQEHIRSKFHRLNELFGSKPLRFMVSPWSIKPVMDVFVQRTIEHGLWTFFAQRTDQIMHNPATSAPNNSIHNNNNNSPDGQAAPASGGAFDSITMHELAFMFVIYVAGNLLAAGAFGVELVGPRLRRVGTRCRRKRLHRR